MGAFNTPPGGGLSLVSPARFPISRAREHLGVVQNQEIPGGQQVRQLGEAVVGDPAGGSNQS